MPTQTRSSAVAVTADRTAYDVRYICKLSGAVLMGHYVVCTLYSLGCLWQTEFPNLCSQTS